MNITNESQVLLERVMEMYEKLNQFLFTLAECGKDAEWLRCVFTAICLYYGINADTSASDDLLLETWDKLTGSDFILSFYSQYADDDRDDEYEEESDPLMARYENGFENYMLEYLI